MVDVPYLTVRSQCNNQSSLAARTECNLKSDQAKACQIRSDQQITSSMAVHANAIRKRLARKRARQDLPSMPTVVSESKDSQGLPVLEGASHGPSLYMVSMSTPPAPHCKLAQQRLYCCRDCSSALRAHRVLSKHRSLESRTSQIRKYRLWRINIKSWHARVVHEIMTSN